MESAPGRPRGSGLRSAGDSVSRPNRVGTVEFLPWREVRRRALSRIHEDEPLFVDLESRLNATMTFAAPLQLDELNSATVACGPSLVDYGKAAFQACPVPMLVLGLTDGLIVDANPAFHRLVGDKLETLAKSGAAGHANADDWLDWRKLTLDAGAARSPEKLILRKTDGSTLSTSATLHRCDGELLLLVFQTLEDLDAREAAATTAEIDPLTGLASRTYFDARLELALQRVRTTGDPHFAVMFMDLDAFKPVNDQFGHAVGDRVLAAVAKRLAAGVRPGDVLSRRGGDEFTLLLESVDDANEARRIAERLWKRAMEPIEVDGHFLHIGVSIGIVLGDGTIDTPEAIVDAADRAMYAAKRCGRPMLHPIA